MPGALVLWLGDLGGTATPGVPVVVSDDIRAAVAAGLLADAAVSAIVGTAVAPAAHHGRRAALPGDMLPPAVTYMVVSVVRDQQVGGPAGVARARVQLDLWGTTLADCLALVRIVRRKWDGFRGDLNGVNVRVAYVDGEEDWTESAAADGDPGNQRHIALDLIFVHSDA